MADPPPRCPVCRAAFRGTTQCSRCGAGLERLMALLAEAHALRRAARQSLRQGRVDDAHELASAAQDRCATEAGRRVLLLTRWLRQGGRNSLAITT